jgi:hypothetical protein
MYRESLPEKCPPESAKTPDDVVLLRLLCSPVPVEEDFQSHQERKPNVVYQDPCRARGVSLMPSIDVCRDVIKLKRMNKFKFAVRVKLAPESGMIEHDKADHCTWWISKQCAPLGTLLDVIEL